MSTITIQSLNESHVLIKSENGVDREIAEKYSFRVDGY